MIGPAIILWAHFLHPYIHVRCTSSPCVLTALVQIRRPDSEWTEYMQIVNPCDERIRLPREAFYRVTEQLYAAGAWAAEIVP